MISVSRNQLVYALAALLGLGIAPAFAQEKAAKPAPASTKQAARRPVAKRSASASAALNRAQRQAATAQIQAWQYPGYGMGTAPVWGYGGYGYGYASGWNYPGYPSGYAPTMAGSYYGWNSATAGGFIPNAYANGGFVGNTYGYGYYPGGFVVGGGNAPVPTPGFVAAPYVPRYPGDMFGANIGQPVRAGTYIPGQGVVGGVIGQSVKAGTYIPGQGVIGTGTLPK